MARVLVVSDSPYVVDDVKAVVGGPDHEIVEVDSGGEVAEAVRQEEPDLVIVDFQIASMGGVAVCLDLRLEESAGRLPHVPVLMLLDRRADVFLARRSEAESWVVKPLDPVRLRRAIDATLTPGGSFHDDSYRPVPT